MTYRQMKRMGTALVPCCRVRRCFSLRHHFSFFIYITHCSLLITHLALCALIASCSSDDEKQQDDRENLNIELRAMITRGADDAGEEEMEENVAEADIHVFIKSTDGVTSDEGLFKYHEDQGVAYWTAQELKVKPGTRTFSLFGYMPESESLSGEVDVENRRLILTGIEPMTSLDICVVTGVRKSSEIAKPERGTYTFDYVNSAYNDRTILNLRLEHLLGRLVFKFKVGARYSALRQIKVKTLKIETKAKESITATVHLPKTIEEVFSVDYSGTGNTKPWESYLLTDTQESIFLSTTAVQVGSSINVAVGGSLSDQYELVSTYDVYDLQGHKLSERTARNKLKDVLPVKSQVKEVELTIEPTYLYQLSDDDLNNPEVVINE